MSVPPPRYATPFYPFQWVKGVPKKVSIFMWRAEQDRLPTLKGLHKRKIIHGSIECKLCGESDEDADHLLTSCYVAAGIWHKIGLWTRIPPIFAFNVKDLLLIHKGESIEVKKQEWVQIIILAAAWIIWKTRNAAIFQGKRANLDGMFGEIQAVTFTWVKNKMDASGWTWNTWKTFDIPSVVR